jgi:glycosyltransferase involved in cell wall biosynthesis
MLWSILIAAIPERYHTVHKLLHSLLENQAVARRPNVELLYLMDNRRRSVGAKRNALLDAAAGEYVSFIDDDDEVAPHYVEVLERAIVETRRSAAPADVICFPQVASIGSTGIIHECSYSLAHANLPPAERRRLAPTDREGVLAWTGPPAHTMLWRAGIAKACRFPEKQFGEDVDWVDKACALATSEVQVPGGPLYYYRFDPERSATR